MEDRIIGVFGHLRAWVHRPYLRAAIGALALAAGLGTIATTVIEIRFGVPARAVVRYFSRLHDSTDDLAPLLRQPDTLTVLDELAYSHAGTNAGGLVYTVDGRLELHPWMPLATAAAEDHAREFALTYNRLLPKYFAAELDELIADLSHLETRRQLGRLGVAPGQVHELRRLAASTRSPAHRARLLRRAGRLILPFMPTGADPHALGLADKLRFYVAHAPRGRYLGLYEVRGPRWLGTAPAEALPATGRRLIITKEAGGRITVEDLSPRRRRAYRLTPVPHPAGLPLYRIAVRA